MALGALVYPITIKAYTDNTFTVLATEKKTYLSVGLLVDDTFPATWITESTSIHLLTPYVENITFLGGSFQYKVGEGTYSGYEPSRFAPLSTGYYYNGYSRYNYIDIIFKNGAYIRYNGVFTSTGAMVYLYSADGVEIASYSGSARLNLIGFNENGFYATDMLVCTEITDKKITGSLYKFKYSAEYHSPYAWQNKITLEKTDLVVLKNFINNYLPEPLSYDPYSGDGSSETGGGGESYDYPYDIIEMPEYDSVETVKRGYANRGFLTVFSPTETEIQNFKAYLFSSSADATIKKMYQSPIEAIVSFAMVPYPVPTLETTSRIYLGGTDTGVDSHLVQYQFITVDFGTLDIEKATRSFNDFSPRTDASIYLPYIGVHELDIDKIMGYQIGLKYYIDVVSGDFIAYLTLNGALDAGTPEYEAMIDSGLQSGVIGQWAGNCLIHIPISSLDFSSRIGATIGLMGSAIGTVGAAASVGPMAPLMLAQLGTMANQAIDMGKVTVKHKGAIPCTTGWLGIQKPYIMLTRPRLSIPEENNLYVGYPTNVYFELSDLTGYTEVQDIHLENVPATSDEIDEIVSLLKEGVII